MGLPHAPLSRVWGTLPDVFPDLAPPAGRCAGERSQVEADLNARRAVAEDAVLIRLRLEAVRDVSLQLRSARIRRVATRPLFPNLSPDASTYWAYLSALLRLVCSDRRYIESPEEIRTSIDAPDSVHLPPGRSVTSVVFQLHEVFADMAYTSEGAPPSITLFAGESVEASFQLVAFGGAHGSESGPYLDQYVFDLSLAQTEIGSSHESAVLWTSPSILLMRFLPPKSVN